MTEGLRVLLIDDDEAEFVIQEKELLQAGLSVHWAPSLEPAFAAMREESFDAVLLDLNLTLTRGVETVRAFRAVNQDIPLVVLSGEDEFATTREALRADAQDYLVKGEEAWRIARSIEHAIERHLYQTTLRDAFGSSDDGIVLTSPEGQILFANPAAAGCFEGSLAEANLSSGRRLHKDGSTLEIRRSQIRWNGLPASLVSLRLEGAQSATPVRLLEGQESLREIQKMEVLGRMASGVSRELDGLLGQILDLAHSEANFGAITSATRSALFLNRQVLSLGVRGVPQREPVELNQLVDQTVFLLRSTLPEGVQLETDFAPRAAHVSADRAQLQHLILNLTTNALDAVGLEGRVCLSTKMTADEVFLVVEDSGPGVPKELKDQIFEPFFGSKMRQLGLGLATTLGIVTEHGGRVELETYAPEGARFRVQLQRLEIEVEPSSQEEGASEASRATILVIDDEDLVIRSVRRTLSRHGMKVKAFTKPEEALEYFALSHASIDVVVLDIVMPTLNGIDCLGKLRAIDPDVKVLVSSGFYNSRLDELNACELLYKPYQSPDLVKAVERILMS